MENTESEPGSTDIDPPRVDLRPPHLLAAGAGLAVICAFISGAPVLWVLVALGLAAGSWVAAQHDSVWPDDVYTFLRARRLTGEKQAGATAPGAPVLSFEPLSIPQVFATTAKVLLRNWPALLGIPIATLLAVMTVFYVAMQIVMAATFDAETERVGGVVVSSAEYDGGNPFAMLAAMFVVMLIVVIVVAFPADAFLLGVFVLATHRAVVGAGVHLQEVMRDARGQIGAMCRMTAAFYAISLMPDLLLVVLLLFSPASLFGPGYVAISMVLSLGMFVLGIALSLAPLVMMVERSGVAQSFRRSVRLAKPALGRLLLLHALWVACAIPLTSLSFMFGTSWVMLAIVFGVMIAGFRVLQMVIYLDLRMRQEGHGKALKEEWVRNTQAVG